ncbi:MAG: hypothetical protein DMF06_06635, partial [Verrucomicrobia bacterium]
MNEDNSTQTEPNPVTVAETAPASATEPRTAPAPPANIPLALDLNELQALGPAELEQLCRDLEVRVHPGKTRHHQILDVIRAALGLGIRVTAEGFF